MNTATNTRIEHHSRIRETFMDGLLPDETWADSYLLTPNKTGEGT